MQFIAILTCLLFQADKPPLRNNWPVIIRLGPTRQAAPITNRKLTIVYDDKSNSKLLHSELTRDWSLPNQKAAQLLGAISAELPLIERRRSLAMERVILVHKNQSFRNLESYPAFRFGDAEKFSYFDERAFSESSYPLRTVEAILNNINADVNAWTAECHEIRVQAEIDYANKVFRWAEETHPLRFKGFLERYYKVERNFELPEPNVLLEEFAGLGVPGYKQPELPECPVMKFPWDNQHPTLLPGKN